ncbi:MAG: hypothetical protein A2452_08675 [Candidatus Firestonebacteria bacterium RIFOXYC2_FULL_39_67]|nr:MAG: hypothetical protein A2536_05660 [Candidatus Firestonebacteria bacterium RIFOXYD2_FULL_39_29]OGF56986.1 MAG: hypothetical protein A2452_08675 [Candidatus Firestonebacteria bacterium RIFOXYC2_FULL_39_67]
MFLNRKTEIFSLICIIAGFTIFVVFSAGFPVFCLAESIISQNEPITKEEKPVFVPEITNINVEKKEITAEDLIKLLNVTEEGTIQSKQIPVLNPPVQNITPEWKFTDNFTFSPIVQLSDVTPEIGPIAPESKSLLISGDLNNKKTDVDVTLKESMPEGLFGKIGVDLPLESRLEITGRKGVSINYGNVIRTNPPVGVPVSGGSSAGGITSGFSLTQDLQVRLSGTVGKRVTVNVDYDDTKEQQRDISLVYKGEPDELIQQAQFGDVILSLPNTEFTGYSKSIFGGDIELKYKNLSLKAIGAQTKGKTKTVSFSGGYSQQKLDISDTSFVKQKYFKLQANDTHLPLTPGTEQIWIDDLNGYNNNYPPNYTTTGDRGGKDITIYTQKTVSGKYSLDCLHPGTDYTIDYTTGIITFNRSIQTNYVVVVAYKYSNGTIKLGYDSNDIFDFDDSAYTSDRVLQPLLGDASYYDRQLMNYYGLGNKKILNPQYDPEFVFKIYDQNNTELPITNFSYSMDLDNGLFCVKTSTTSSTNYEKPFALPTKPDAYPTKDSALTQNRYKIHVEYKYKFKTYQLPNFSIVKYSETLLMDGNKLSRDVDYTIDYDSGFIFFFNEDKITDKTKIDVTYEYMPFGGGFQSNLFGVRAELRLDPLSIGSTYLYTGGQTPIDVPAAGSTPASLGLLDIDGKISISQTMIDSVFGRIFFLPTDISISAEMAKSTYNPNIFQSKTGEPGVGMIDGMESSDNITGLGIDYNAWFTSSVPTDQTATLTDNNRYLIKDFLYYEEYSHDTTITTKKQMLKIEYNLNPGNWDSIRYVISPNGSDFSKFKYLEIWMNTDWSKDVDFNVDIGTISEDINNNGKLDTEDTNGDGAINIGEDVGISVNTSTGFSTVGAGNNNSQRPKPDTEDLNNNGILEGNDKESFFRYSFNTGSIPASNIASTVVNSLGTWKLIKIPLQFEAPVTPIGSPAPNASFVKHARIWLKSATGAASSILLESVQFSGNKWELKDLNPVKTLNVRAVNQLLDSSYIPLTDVFFIANTTADLNREQSLSLTYSSTNTSGLTIPYVYKSISKPINFMEYRNIRFDIYKKKATTGDKIFLRIGSDETSYLEYRVSLDSVAAGWQTITIPISGPDDSAHAASFYLNNVKVISLGVLSSGTDGEIWLNNLRLSDPDIKEGLASRLGGTVRFGDFFSTTLDYKNIDSMFNFFEDSSVNSSLAVSQTYASVKQNQMYYSVSSNLKLADFMPVNITYRRDETTTKDTDKTNPNYISYPEKASDNYGAGMNLSLFNPLNINLNAAYKTEDIQYLPGAVSTVDNTRSKVYNLYSRATYTLPNTLFGLIPLGSNNFEGEFKFAEDQMNHSVDPSRNSYSIMRESYGKWNGGYELLSGFNINPFYQLRQLDKRGNVAAYNPSVGNSNTSYLNDFETQTLGRGAGLNVVYSKLPGCSPKVNYNATVDRDYNVNQLRTGTSLEIASDFRLSEWFEFLASASPSINLSHRISANALYDKYDNSASTAPITNLTDLDIWGLVPADAYSFNSSQLITDTGSGRFKIATITFNPRGSISYEGNRQSQFLTKTNVYSLGSGINIENPPIPLLSILNLTNLDMQYDFKNIARKDSNDKIISNSFSHSGNLTMPFRVSEAFNGSLSFSTNIEDRLENNVIYMNRAFNPGIDIYQNLNFLDPIKLPDFLFGGAIIKIEQTIRINYKFNLAMTRNTSNSITVLSNVNTDNYIAGAFIQYSFSKNIRADIGLQFNYFVDNVSNVNNYYAYGLNVKVNAVF